MFFFFFFLFQFNEHNFASQTTILYVPSVWWSILSSETTRRVRICFFPGRISLEPNKQMMSIWESEQTEQDRAMEKQKKKC